MPTYEYACDACGHKFEEFQSITAKPLTKCPVCKKNRVKRLISAGAGFIFKGSGFYITDYRSENYKAGEKSASSAADGSKTDSSKTDGVKADTKTETAKPADKAPAKTETKSESKPATKAAPAKGAKK
jgi:putative FmdB family regulatory protein